MEVERTPQSLRDWSVEDVCQWAAQTVQLPDASVACLRSSEVDGATLLELTADDLRSIGITVLGQYKKILRQRDALTLSTAAAARTDIIAPKDLQLIRKIGGGHYGEVWIALWLEKTTVAVKWLHQSSEDFLAETSLLQKLQHPHVVNYYGLSPDPETNVWRLVTEFMEDGSLLSWLREAGSKANLGTRCKVCRDIVTGMDYLAKKGIIHRDLAARNVLIRKLGFGDVLCKLCDFGMGRALVEDAYVVSDPKATELPVRWTAPEALEKKRYSLKSDVFSFGVLVWEVESFGAEPYVGWPLGSILKRLKAGERLEQPTGCPDTLYSVMLQCWDLDPDKRPSWESLYNMFKDAWRNSSPMESSGKFDEKEELDAGSKIYQDADLGYNQQYLLQGNGEDGYGAGAYVAPDKNSSTTTTPTSRSMSMSEYDSDAEASSESYSIITRSDLSNVSSSAARPPVLVASGTAAVSVMRSSSNRSPESNKNSYGYLRSSANDAGARDSSSESEGRSLQRRATASSPFCRRESSAAAAPGLNASRSACDIKREKKKQQKKDPAKLREENEAFVIRTLTEQEPKMLWKALHYFEGTLAEAKEEAKATQKPIYMTMLVNGPEPEVPCVGARLFRCTVLSDQRIIDRISQNFIPVVCNLSEQKFPDELFRPALNEILFWYNSLQPGSSLNWSGEIVIDVDSNGVSTLVGGCSWIHDELENLFCYEGFTRMLDKAMKKREDIQSMKQNRAEKKVVGTIKSAFNVAKGELARGANDIKHAWSFRKQMKVSPVTDETLYRLQYNGLLEGKRKQNASDAAAEVKPE